MGVVVIDTARADRTLMRGGTSKGLYFQPRDLPTGSKARDTVLLASMGSPDIRQIDGVGGAHPLTSKVAVLSAPTRADADIDYHFLQVVVDKASGAKSPAPSGSPTMARRTMTMSSPSLDAWSRSFPIAYSGALTGRTRT